MKTRNVIVFPGRFQPFHLLHWGILYTFAINNKDKEILICLVDGEKTSKNKEVNPFDRYIRMALIDSCIDTLPHNVDLYLESLPTGYIPKIQEIISEDGYNIVGVLCGEDRRPKYITMAPHIEVFCIPRTVDISGTAIRQMIRDNDFNGYLYNMPEELSNRETFNRLREEI